MGVSPVATMIESPVVQSKPARPPVHVAVAPPEAAGQTGITEPLICAEKVSVFYGDNEAIKKVSIVMPRNKVVAMIGPSGCGKSTFLRSINRLNDLIPGCRVTGQLYVGPHNIYDPKIDLVALR